MNSLNVLLVTCSSVALEWQNDSAYYSPKPYTVFLDGKEVLKSNTNVFSLFNLIPDCEYTLTTDMTNEIITFRTLKASTSVSVLDFGARANGKDEDTVAIQTAIHCLPKDARLVFPTGTYLTAPLCLKSHITLEFQEGATLLGVSERKKYPVIPGEISDLVRGETIHFGTWEGEAVPMHQSLLFAEYAEDITIIGQGVIDGNGQNSLWWSERKNYPIARPRLVFFNRCDKIIMHGITLQNSPSWSLHPYFSSNIDILGLKVFAPNDSPNTDAIDPESCDGVNIIGCQLSVGDDCIAIKSGKIEIAKRFERSASRHTIRNCLMQHGHGAITLGSEMAGGVNKLCVSQCRFENTDRGLRIKSRRGRGKLAVIDGVVFENLLMDGVKTPIVMNMWYNCCDPDRDSEYVWSREYLPVDDLTPYLGEFTFKNMQCLNCEAAACYCDGLPEMPIKSITLQNIYFNYCENAKPSKPAMRAFIEDFCKCGMYFDNVVHLTLDNVILEGAIGDPLIAKHVGTIEQKNNDFRTSLQK